MPQLNKNNAVKIIILAGLAIRLIIAPLAANFGDCFNWYGFAQLAINDYLKLYAPQSTVPLSNAFYSYPPLWALVLGIFLSPLFLFKISGIYGTLFLIKLPVILTGVFLAKKIWDYTKSAKAVAFFYLSPLMIFLEAVWGAFDIVPAALVFFSYFCARKERYGLCALLLSAAAAFKIWPLLVFAGMIIYLAGEKKSGAILKFCIVFVSSFIVFLSPFVFSDAANLLKNTLFHHAGRGINWHMSIWSVWYWLAELKAVKLHWLYFADNRIFLPNLVFYLAVLVMYEFWLRSEKRNLLPIYVFPALMFLMFSPWVTPSYLAWVFAFFALLPAAPGVFSKSDYFLLNTLPIVSELCASSRYALSTGMPVSFDLMAYPMVAAMFFSSTACVYFYIWVKISGKILLRQEELNFFAQQKAKTPVFTAKEKTVILILLLIFIIPFALVSRPQRANPANEIFPAYAKVARNKFIYNNLGVLYAQNGYYYKEAEWAFRESIALDKCYDKALINLAVFYAKQKEFKKAVERFEEAVKVTPKNYSVYEKLIYCCFCQETPDRAKAKIYYNKGRESGVCFPQEIDALMKE